MSLETGTYISDLITTNPVGATDKRSQGDDHLRLIKTTLKNSILNTFTAGLFIPPQSTSLAKALIIGAGQALWAGAGVLNGTLVASVAGSALTIALKTLAGADPSATDPVYFVFRDATSATGDYIIRTVTAATSVVVASTKTLGTSNSVPFRIWILAVDTGAGVELGVVNVLSGTSIMALREHQLVSPTATPGNSAQTIYTTSGQSNKPFRFFGWAEWSSGLATAGTWSGGPTKLHLFGHGDAKPGDIIQTVRTDSAAVATGSTAIPSDDTIPQSTEGDQYLSQAITATSAANQFHVVAKLLLTNSTSVSSLAMALFQDAGANAIAATHVDSVAAAIPGQGLIDYRAITSITTSTTFKVRGGGPGATTTFNGTGGGRLYGGVINSYIEIEEVMT